jgi:hypothetical protein
VDSTHRITASAALTIGLLLAVSFAGSVQAGGAKSQRMTAQQWNAVKARSEAWNRYYHVGAFSPSEAATAQRAEECRAQAFDRYHHLGRYVVIRVSSRFVWTDAGIGAGAMLGAILAAAGLTVAVRRRATGKTPFPTTS